MDRAEVLSLFINTLVAVWMHRFILIAKHGVSVITGRENDLQTGIVGVVFVSHDIVRLVVIVPIDA